MRRPSGLAIVLVFIIWGPKASMAQNQPPLPVKTPVPTGNLVKLYATVLDKKHRLVLNLSQSDFRVFEDKQERPVHYFSSRVEEPLALGVLIDVSRYTLDEPDPPDWQSLSSFLRETLRPGDEAFVASFDEHTALLTPWTEDTHLLDDALLQALNTKRDHAAAVLDAIYTLCEERFSSEHGRKALVVVSDSSDDFSGHTQLEVLEMAQRSETAIYPILPWVNVPGAPVFRNGKFATLFSDQTGGFYFPVVKPKDLDRSLAGIREILNHLYVLGFYPTDTSRDDRYHEVKVGCARRGTQLYARQGYYAPERKP